MGGSILNVSDAAGGTRQHNQVTYHLRWGDQALTSYKVKAAAYSSLEGDKLVSMQYLRLLGLVTIRDTISRPVISLHPISISG